jgi:beta-lactamase regulating signal transducer with metallopeptidase domain
MNTTMLISIAVQHVWQSALVFAVTAGLLKVCPLQPGARSWAWLGALVLAACLPLAVFAPSAAHWPALAATAMPAPQHALAPVAAALPAAASDGLPLSALDVAIALWLTGAAWQLRTLWLAWRAARHLRRRAIALPRLQDLMRVTGGYPIAACEGIASPLTVGLLRPCILIPRALAASLTDAHLIDVVHHEIAHIRRGDPCVSLVQQVLTALYWWSPVFRLIGARLDMAREMACDEQAAMRSGKPAAYAGALLACAAPGMPREHGIALGSRMFGGSSALAQRIEALLQTGAATGKARRIVVALVWGASLTVVMGATVAATPRLAGVDNGVDGEGTALIVAARAGDLQQVDALIGQGAQVDLAWPGDGNPLIAAASHGRFTVVARLVAAGADVNAVTPYDETPLINAAREGQIDIVRYLVAHGARVNLGVWADGHRWRTPLNQTRSPAVKAFLASQGATS